MQRLQHFRAQIPRELLGGKELTIILPNCAEYRLIHVLSRNK